MAPKSEDGRGDTLRHLLRAMGKFRDLRESGEIPIQQMIILTYVGLHGEVTQADLQHDLNMSSSSVSRNIAAVSTPAGSLGLITWVDHPTDRRAKVITMTHKGWTFINPAYSPNPARLAAIGGFRGRGGLCPRF